MNKRRYALPAFLATTVSQEAYERWLRHKAQAHVRRDRRRARELVTGEAYRAAIHRAVLDSQGCDAYTGESLDWSLISQYDNVLSQERGTEYKHGFALLPTVDHDGQENGQAIFRICSWRTNDAKNDLDMPEFLALCQAVLEHHGYQVTKQL